MSTSMVPGLQHLEWPFFGAEHRALASRFRDWAAQAFAHDTHPETRTEVDAECRSLVARLGQAGWTGYCVRKEDGGTLDNFDARAISVLRESLAWWNGLADFAFAMQGLGSGALSIAGSQALKARYLPHVARGEAIAAFALSEPAAGSDVAAMTCQARHDGNEFVLDGAKTWISNGGIADFYCVFARTSPGAARADGSIDAAGISAFVVERGDAGLSIDERIDVIAPHPLATLGFKACRIPEQRLIGEVGQGFRIAMRTLDVFRTSVAAAALGFGQRAFDEALAHAQARTMFGKRLADFQLTQAALADMATELEAARLLTYRAAWLRDRGDAVTAAAAMAKLTATETAQRVIDRALQMFGGRGVVHGEVVERLYREIRALRIYEGASEVQRLIIGRELLKAAKGTSAS
jgi:acyl-CoA dehydrogenase